MLGSNVAAAAALLFLSIPAPAGEAGAAGDDFIVGWFKFGSLAGATAMAPDGSFALAADEFFSGKSAGGFDRDGSPVAGFWDLQPGTPPEVDSVDIAAMGNDDFVVVWKGVDDSFAYVIHARRFQLDGTPRDELLEVASSTDGSSHTQPVVEAWSSAGGTPRFLVSWTYEPPGAPATGTEIAAASFDATDSELGPGVFIVNQFTAGDQDSPAVSADTDSISVVVWRSDGSPGDDDDGSSVQARRFVQSLQGSGQFQVNTTIAGDQQDPDVAVAPNGRFLVVWSSSATTAGTEPSVRGRLFEPSLEPLAPDFEINASTPNVFSRPAVEARADGSFFVVWRSPQGIRGRVVRSDGGLAGGETGIDTTETEVYRLPTVAGAENGRFVVTWDTEDDENYGDYRRARILETSLFADGFESGDTGAWSVTVP